MSAASLRLRLDWFNTLRWGAGFGVLAAVLIVGVGFEEPILVRPLVLTAGVLLLMNLAYVLRGRARVTIDDEVHEVRAGTVLLIPAGVPHDYRVLEAPFEFLCMVPNEPDRIEILED